MPVYFEVYDEASDSAICSEGAYALETTILSIEVPNRADTLDVLMIQACTSRIVTEGLCHVFGEKILPELTLDT